MATENNSVFSTQKKKKKKGIKASGQDALL
jgi:hypothetical protein